MKSNYYQRVVRPAQKMKQNPVFRKWAAENKLTGRQIVRATRALISGKSSFQE